MKRKIEDLHNTDLNNHENENENKNENEKIEPDNKKQKIYDECPICFEKILDQNYVVTNCNHKFCFGCLMKSCIVKNQCPMCRTDIKEFKNKTLPIFKHTDMFENIISSINNPAYNPFHLIDDIKSIIFEEFLEEHDDFSVDENRFKNSIIRRLQYSRQINENIDICCIDNIQEFISKIVIENTVRMCLWFEQNFNKN